MNNETRQTFAAGLVGAAASAWSAQATRGANDRVRLGVIGRGGRGTGLWRAFLRKAGVEPEAVGDVYQPFLNRAVQARRDIATPHRDFRHLLALKNIDAVIIALPDHWHALQTVMACRSGKDVDVEKPLSQVGSRQRSGSRCAHAIELIGNGTIGR